MPTAADTAAQLATYDANRVTSTDATNAALAQFGVPEIRNTVSGLRTTLANTTNAYNNVDPSVTGRTQGSLVTEAQRSKQVANEEAPIAAQISDQTKALGDANTNLTDAEGQASQQATNAVNDWSTGRAALQSEYDSEYKSESDAAAAAAAKAENDRQYQLAVQSASASSASSAKQTPADIKLAAGQHVASQLAGNTGKDGYVSNETWAAALNDAVASGFTVREFYQKYSQFVNPKYKTSYAGWANR